MVWLHSPPLYARHGTNSVCLLYTSPGLLKVMSYYMPDVFPYQAHWKMSECHRAYWEYVPTVDHIIPISLGGADDIKNRVIKKN